MSPCSPDLIRKEMRTTTSCMGSGGTCAPVGSSPPSSCESSLKQSSPEPQLSSRTSTRAHGPFHHPAASLRRRSGFFPFGTGELPGTFVLAVRSEGNDLDDQTEDNIDQL